MFVSFGEQNLSLCCDVYLNARASFCVEIFLVAVFCVVQLFVTTLSLEK